MDMSDQELSKHIHTILLQSDPTSITSLNDVVSQLESQLGFNLSHKSNFIRDQINLLLLKSHPTVVHYPNDHFALNPQIHPHFVNPNQQMVFKAEPDSQQIHPHFVNPNQQMVFKAEPDSEQMVFKAEPGSEQMVFKAEPDSEQMVFKAEADVAKSVPAKKKGGAGGLNKVCGVTPELQVIVGQPALPRTEIVKQLWAYIRRNNLQDPSNKRKIICDDALRAVFEIDCTDMFKMNKLLSKHIIRLEPTKESNQAKKLKVEGGSPTENGEPAPQIVIMSEALAHFFGTGERKFLQSEVLKRIWEYIKVNNLEDPMNKMVILCDAKLQQLLGCDSISALGIPEMLARHHLFKRYDF